MPVTDWMMNKGWTVAGDCFVEVVTKLGFREIGKSRCFNWTGENAVLRYRVMNYAE